MRPARALPHELRQQPDVRDLVAVARLGDAPRVERPGGVEVLVRLLRGLPLRAARSTATCRSRCSRRRRSSMGSSCPSRSSGSPRRSGSRAAGRMSTCRRDPTSRCRRRTRCGTSRWRSSRRRGVHVRQVDDRERVRAVDVVHVARRRARHVGVRRRVQLVADDRGEDVADRRLRRVRSPDVVLHVREVRILVAGDRAQVAAALRAGRVRVADRASPSPPSRPPRPHSRAPRPAPARPTATRSCRS